MVYLRVRFWAVLRWCAALAGVAEVWQAKWVMDLLPKIETVDIKRLCG